MTIDEVQSKAHEELFLVVLSWCEVFALMIWWIIKVMQVTTTFTTCCRTYSLYNVCFQTDNDLERIIALPQILLFTVRNGYKDTKRASQSFFS